MLSILAEHEEKAGTSRKRRKISKKQDNKRCGTKGKTQEKNSKGMQEHNKNNMAVQTEYHIVTKFHQRSHHHGN